MLLCCMKTISDVFIAYKKGLNNLYGANEAETITLIAVSEVCGFSNAKIKAFPELGLSRHQSEEFYTILNQLKTGKPIQYILGKTEFFGLPFNVNPSVLIPRPETEELVEWVLSSVGSGQRAVGSRQSAVSSRQFAVHSVLDIGTGSGCIAISLKKHLPNANISAIDVSAEALKTAKENAKLNDVEIDFIEGDILIESSFSQISNLPAGQAGLKSQISIIISNPPYVTLHDKTKMHINVTDFEPYTALFVPEDDPLMFYKAIAGFAVNNLAPNGLLFFEINESYGEQIVGLLGDKGFKNIELRKDMNGKSRMIKTTLK